MLRSEVFYVLIRHSESFDWERDDIITGSRLKDLLDELCKKLEDTVDYELSKRSWITNIGYRVERVQGIYLNAQMDEIFKDHMEDLE